MRCGADFRVRAVNWQLWVAASGTRAAEPETGYSRPDPGDLNRVVAKTSRATDNPFSTAGNSA